MLDYIHLNTHIACPPILSKARDTIGESEWQTVFNLEKIR